MEPTLHIPRPGGGSKPPSGRRTTLIVAGALVVVVAVAAFAPGLLPSAKPENTALTSPSAPTTSRPVAAVPTTSVGQQAPPPADNSGRPALPVRVDVDAINAHSSLVQLGLNSDKTVEVPPVSQPLQ